MNVQRHQDLSQSYTIPPDGVIDFPRIGRLSVLGKTIAEISDDLQQRFAQVLRDPEVSVTLLEMRPLFAYVLGSVSRPGPYLLTNGMRLTELLATAGDLTGERETLTACLIRAEQTIPLNLQAAILGKDPAANPVIHDGDLLWVQPPARITVVVSGQVKTPGVVKLPPKGTLIDALAQTGDLLDRHERMEITLLRGTTTQPLKWGDTSTVLQDGDVILVEKERLSRIYVNGHVRNPGAYDLPVGGGVLEAIALAGGVLTNPALGQVVIVRQDGKSEQINLVSALVEGKVDKNPKLASGDQVIVPESTKRVSVLGMVNHPGQIPFNENKVLTVVDAISIAGGGSSRGKLSQTVVIRTLNGKVQRLPVDVNSILKKGKQELNIPLQPDDIIYVPETDHPEWTNVLSSLYQVGLLATVL